MGCDIHLWIEARAGADAPWRLARPMWRCHWCDGRGHNRGEEPCYWCKGSKQTTRFDDRNYTLFSMLADVRNEYGLAGPPWRKEIDRLAKLMPDAPRFHEIDGEPAPYIAKPRGWPSDMSPELRAHLTRAKRQDSADANSTNVEAAPDKRVPGMELAWPGDHSPSWVTVREVLDYLEKGHVRVERGFVALTRYRGWPDNYYGQSYDEDIGYCKGIGGGSIRVISEERAKQLLADEDRGVALPDHHYVQAEWSVPITKQLGETFLEHFLPAVRALGRPEHVRLVFNFDS